MIEWFIEMMATNTIAQGVFAGMLASAPLAIIMWLLRDLPRKLWELLMINVEKNLVFLSTMNDYEDLVHCIEKYVVFSRFKTIMGNEKVTLGYGTHWGKYEGTWFKLKKELEENHDSYAFKEKTTITFYEWTDKSADLYVSEAVQSKTRKLRVFANNTHDWDCMGPLPPRPLESVFFSGKHDIVNHIKDFDKNEEYYSRRGMPYHTGILLHGKPGTGKTSLIKAIANECGRSLFVLNPSVLKQGGYSEVISGIDWDTRILVIEDIDVSGAAVGRDDVGTTTLSDLLNALDGIFTPHGMVTIATTNHVKKLDPAIIRPGRFDMLVEMGDLTEADAREMADAFEKPLNNYEPMTGAELRRELLNVD